MADQNPPVQWGEDPTEGEEPEGGGDFVGPPGWANDLTLLQMMQALWRFYRPNMLHRGLNADMLDGKHLQSIYDELATLYIPGAGTVTDNAIARFDGTTGLLLQNSGIIIADTTNNLSGVGSLSLAASLASTTPNIFAPASSTYGIAIGADFVSIVIGGVSKLLVASDGKVTIPGLLDPTGLEMTPVSANPGGTAANTLWADSGAGNRFKVGSNTLAYLSEVGTGGDVTAASNITDNAVVRGDGGAKGVQNSGVVIDDPSSSTIRIHTGAAAHILLTPDTSLSSGTFDTTVDAGGTGSTTLNLGTVAANATNVGRSGKTTTVNGLASLAGQARLAINTPSQITSNQTGYTGFNTGIVQRASTDASRTINTILAPTGDAGGYLRVINVGSYDLVLLNDDGATGTAADRIITGLGTNYTLGPAQACELIYDTTSSRWRVL